MILAVPCLAEQPAVFEAESSAAAADLRIDLKLPGQFLYVQISGNRITDLGNYADCCIQIAQKLGLIAQIQSLPQIAQAKCSRCFFGIFR